MQKHLLLLLSLVLISGCLGGSNVQKAAVGVSETKDNPDVYLKIESVPSEVDVGRTLNLIFTMQNKQNKEIANVRTTAFDQCLFSGDVEEEIANLRPNRTERWSWKWTAGQTQFNRECTLKFRTEYENNFTLSQDIIVLKESEFLNRELQGTLDELTPISSASNNPLVITVGFSEEQPFLENDLVLMQIEYSNVGNGFIDKINSGDITIKIPTNLNFVECGTAYNYDSSTKTMALAKTLTFINNRAPTSSCRFNTTAQQPIDIKPLTLNAKYKYSFDNSIIVKVNI